MQASRSPPAWRAQAPVSSQSSAEPGTTATSSTTARASVPSAATRAPTASRTVPEGTARHARRGERLRDEEGIAARRREEAGRVPARLSGEHRDGPLREMYGSTRSLPSGGEMPPAAA